MSTECREAPTDLVVRSRRLLEIPLAEILDTEVVLTVVGGRVEDEAVP